MNLVERLREHQKKAQRGISGYGKQLYEKVNEFCAEIYADTGLAADRIEALEADNIELKALWMKALREIAALNKGKDQ